MGPADMGSADVGAPEGVGRASGAGGSSRAKGTGGSGRIGVFDVARGAAVVSMVLFHLCYDLRYIWGVDLAWFSNPLREVWRCSISWTFLFIAGCMCPLSRSNLRRAAQYGAVALGIWVVTSVAAVDTPISFGIIYCMAACTLVAWALSRAGALPRGPVAAVILIVAFILLLDLRHGTVGLGGLTLEVPRSLYDSGLLAWLGLPGDGFTSGDYYPLLPYLMLYLAGAAMGTTWARRGYPAWAREARLGPLGLVGRHALAVYVVHQPVLLGVSWAAARLLA